MLEDYRNQLPEYAKDLKLNLNTILLSEETESPLTTTQIASIALASAYATREKALIEAIENHTKDLLDDATISAVKSAASIMAMNNVYYRFIHLVSDKEYQSMPAHLRMNVVGNPGIEKTDFELMSLAVSAINGCGLCMDAHNGVLAKAGITKKAIQDAVRIAAVINGLGQVSCIENN